MIGEDYKIGKTYPGDEKKILLEVKSKQPPQFESIIINKDDECAKGLIAKFIEFIRNW